MNYIKCPECNGSKRGRGMGGMYKPCTRCSQIGYIEDAETSERTEIEPKNLQETEVKVVRRRGRRSGASANAKSETKAFCP